MDELHEYLREVTDEWPGSVTYTLHMQFLAADGRQAVSRARRYVESLNLVRPEVEAYTARVSAGEHLLGTAVFCGSPGPDVTDVCVDVAGHPGRHHGPGATRTWSQEQVPIPPDTAEGVT